MSVAVKKGEEARDDRTQPQRSAHRECDQEPEHDDRGNDCRFHEWNVQAEDRCSETHEHHRHEDARPNPHCAPARNHPPQSDRKHSENVVCTAEGMRKPGYRVAHVHGRSSRFVVPEFSTTTSLICTTGVRR